MKELTYHTMQQGTEEWLQVKAGKFSGTDAAAFFVGGPDKISTGLQTLIYKKCAELVVGPDLDGFKSRDMQRGNDLEPIAKKKYESEYFETFQDYGFIQWGDYFGFSPDGLLGDDRGAEFKCPAARTYIKWLDCGQTVADIPSGYFLQIQWALFITGRKSWDYVVYHPDFAPNDMRVTTVNPDEIILDLFERKCLLVKAEMERILNLIAQKEAA